MTRKRSSHFRRPYQKPNVDRSKPFSPALAFAINFDMLSDEEIEGCRKGDLCIEGPWLTNLNSATVANPTGTRVQLYKDRRFRILENRLLGLDEEPKT